MGDLFQQIIGKYKYSEVSEFYKKFSQIWMNYYQNLYRRGEESLELEYKLDGKQLRVLFNISPNKSE